VVSKEQANVVFVHGAWADGSSWNDAIGPLLSRGFLFRGPYSTDVTLSASFFR
jgi:hypothetical protein